MSAYSIATRGLAGRKVPQGVLTPMGDLLFAASEPGAWYDPSDMSTLFQDSAGTTPVTAVEQPVGLILDKSKGLALGPELVTNGDFSNGTTGWSAYNAVISAVNGTLKVDDSSNLGANSSAVQQLNLVAGRTYLLTFDVVSVSGAWSIGFATTDSSVGITFPSAMLSKNTTGPQRFVFTYDGTRNFLFMDADGSGIVFYDNISVKELPGNHATQATTTKRPTYSRRVNLLTQTEDFSTWQWPGGGQDTALGFTGPRGLPNAARLVRTTGSSAYVAFNASTGLNVSVGFRYAVEAYLEKYIGIDSVLVYCGSGNAPGVLRSLTVNTITGAVVNSAPGELLNVSTARIGSFWRVRYEVICANASASILYPSTPLGAAVGDGIYIAEPTVALATDAHLPYQRINTDTDYDADPAKFPAYLRFDGVDDALQTGNIDFTGTDKMTVWAGVTKLSDAALSIVAELADGAVNGAISLQAPFGAASPGFLYLSRGSTARWVATAAYPSPSTAVLTGVSDISGDVVSLRVNTAVVATTTTDQGSENYGNYPLYIGARTGTSNYFNGRLGCLIVRGAQSSLSQIEATELYMKKKVGIA